MPSNVFPGRLHFYKKILINRSRAFEYFEFDRIVGDGTSRPEDELDKSNPNAVEWKTAYLHQPSRVYYVHATCVRDESYSTQNIIQFQNP